MSKPSKVKRKKFYIRNFLKELKRVRWNAEKNLLKSLTVAAIFVILTILLFTAVALLAQSLLTLR